ncbi:kelch-like protein diablo isoform X3 [Hydra vulgaris]|uniref:Kelch-like protein diablo isoform X3 n=1 Tax=Hydra vulgaris TaxID=6087 RepID=A0ABM4CD64_HYDVU
MEKQLRNISNHSVMILKTLKRYREDAIKLCDLVLQVEDQVFPVHRSVLAACSQYFYAMFAGELKESSQSTVVLNDVKANILKQLLDFAYDGEIEIHSKNVEDILRLATQLQFIQVCDICCNFLEQQLDTMNCINIRNFATLYNCISFTSKIDIFMENNFKDVINSDEFKNLPFSVLKSLISSHKLNVVLEQDVYNAVIKWVKFDLNQRRNQFFALLNEVKLPLLSKKFIMQHIINEELIKSEMSCRDLLDEAKNYHLYPKMRAIFRSKRTIPRYSTVGLLFAIGGKETGEQITNKVECFSMFDNSWKSLTSLWSHRQQLGVCVLKSKIYAIAGSDGDNRLNSVEVFDWSTNSWNSSTPLQTCRSGVGVGALRGSIYALGGYDGHHCLSSVERFNPIDNKWHFIASMNFARSFPGVASLNDLIYVIGGNDGSTFLNTCECYDPHTDKWCTINPMNNGRAGVGCAVLDGCLYVAGGYDGIKRLNLVEKYDPNTDTWVCLSPMTSCRDGVSLASYGGYIFAIGGIDGPSYLNSVEYYDPLNDTWMPSQEMRTSRAACGVAVLSNKEL